MAGPSGEEARPLPARLLDAMSRPPGWWARGLLFESCNCQVVCPGHIHFSQQCTHERCIGYWALRFDEGRYGGIRLDGTRAVVAFECPRLMIAGDWTEVLLIDEAASSDQRAALETILRGDAGGPWEVLARFVSEWLPTRFAPIRIEDRGKVKRVRVGVPHGSARASNTTVEAAGPSDPPDNRAGGTRPTQEESDPTGPPDDRARGSATEANGSLLEASIEDIRGRDRDLPVTLRNMFNQIHAPTQTLARGETRGDVGAIHLRGTGTHGLHSRFEWRVGDA